MNYEKIHSAAFLFGILVLTFSLNKGTSRLENDMRSGIAGEISITKHDQDTERTSLGCNGSERGPRFDIILDGDDNEAHSRLEDPRYIDLPMLLLCKCVSNLYRIPGLGFSNFIFGSFCNTPF